MSNAALEPYGHPRLDVRLVQEAHMDAMLTEKLFSFTIPAAKTIRVPLR